MDARGWTISEFLCVLALVAGLGLRFHRLAEPLWYDEAVSVKSASLPLSGLRAQLTGGEDSNPPLFSLILKTWIKTVGDSDARLHLLTALLGSVALLSALWTGASLGGRPTGLFTAALLAFHPAGLAYSQEVRPYALQILLSLWSCFFLARALESGARRAWAGFAAATALNLYTHNYAVFLLVGQAAWLLRERPQAWRGFAAACAAAFAAYGPWLLAAVEQTRRLPSLPPVGAHGALFQLYAIGGLWILSGTGVALWPPQSLLPLLALEAAAAVFLFMTLRRKDAARADGLALAFAAAVVVPFTASLFRPIMLVGRHWVVALPALCLLAGLALESLGDRPARLAALALLLGIGAGTGWRYFAQPKSYEKEIAGFLRAHDAPGARLVLYPAYRAAAIARYYPRAAQAGEGLDVSSAKDLPETLVLMLEAGRRLKPVQLELLDRYYRVDAGARFGNLEIAVFAKRSAPRS